jgi:hypothetical protein
MPPVKRRAVQTRQRLIFSGDLSRPDGMRTASENAFDREGHFARELRNVSDFLLLCLCFLSIEAVNFW